MDNCLGAGVFGTTIDDLLRTHGTERMYTFIIINLAFKGVGGQMFFRMPCVATRPGRTNEHRQDVLI